MSNYLEDVEGWIEQSANIVLVLEREQLSSEDTQRLEQIKAWCKESPLLWKIIARIGWEINEG